MKGRRASCLICVESSAQSTLVCVESNSNQHSPRPIIYVKDVKVAFQRIRIIIVHYYSSKESSKHLDHSCISCLCVFPVIIVSSYPSCSVSTVMLGDHECSLPPAEGWIWGRSGHLMIPECCSAAAQRSLRGRVKCQDKCCILRDVTISRSLTFPKMCTRGETSCIKKKKSILRKRCAIKGKQ